MAGSHPPAEGVACPTGMKGCSKWADAKPTHTNQPNPFPCRNPNLKSGRCEDIDVRRKKFWLRRGSIRSTGGAREGRWGLCRRGTGWAGRGEGAVVLAAGAGGAQEYWGFRIHEWNRTRRSRKTPQYSEIGGIKAKIELAASPTMYSKCAKSRKSCKFSNSKTIGWLFKTRAGGRRISGY